jgi:two-component system sensor histidine kinase KdpD
MTTPSARSAAAGDVALPGHVLAVFATAAATAFAAIASHVIGLRELAPIYLLAVLLVAATSRTGPAVLASLLGALAYNFFFFEPRYTLHIDDPRGWASLLLFLATALIAGRLAARLAMQVRALQRTGEDAALRRELAQRLAGAGDEEALREAAHELLGRAADATIWLRLEPIAQAGSSPDWRDAEAQRADMRGEQQGWWFVPLLAGPRTLGSIGFQREAGRAALDPPRREFLRLLVDDVAQALVRLRLAQELQAERVAGETERLRNALLASVSHDLRTPLASIIGAADSLQGYGEQMTPEDRAALLDAIRDEGERLDRYIRNLLDMTRLGHGALRPARDWIGVDELIGAAIARVRRQWPAQRFQLALMPGAAPIHVHPALMEQALVNVIENAASFSPAGEPVTVQASRDHAGTLRIDIVDRGPGIPHDERERVFERFYSAQRGDRGRQGTGLGLAICRAILIAHRGSADALPGDDGVGTRLRLSLPAQDADPAAPQ